MKARRAMLFGDNVDDKNTKLVQGVLWTDEGRQEAWRASERASKLGTTKDGRWMDVDVM